MIVTSVAKLLVEVTVLMYTSEVIQERDHILVPFAQKHFILVVTLKCMKGLILESVPTLVINVIKLSRQEHV